MDLDSCVLQGVHVEDQHLELEEVNALGNPRQMKPVLDRESIRWRNIDGPRSLMIA